MLLGMAEARRFLTCEKRLVGIKPWLPCANRDGRADKHIFEARVEVDETLPRGLWFRAIAYPRFPGVGTFQLECDRPDSRTHDEIYRLDWRPLRSHPNPFFGPPEYRGHTFQVGETHDHSCSDNGDQDGEAVRPGPLKYGRPVTPDPDSFQEALNLACAKLNISNCSEIPRPEFQEELF